MRIMIICSKKNYGLVEDWKISLENLGHTVILPNCIDNPNAEAESKVAGTHAMFKRTMYQQSASLISSCDAVLCINPTRNDTNGYIGGATFIELYEAYNMGKKIYLTDIVEQLDLCDEVDSFLPTVISGIEDIPSA